MTRNIFLGQLRLLTAATVCTVLICGSCANSDPPPQYSWMMSDAFNYHINNATPFASKKIWDTYPIPGGQVALRDDQMMAMVVIDGRYPGIETGFVANERITETLVVQYGGIVVESTSKESAYTATIHRMDTYQTGDTCVILPETLYSISGKAVVKVLLGQPWNKEHQYTTPLKEI